MSYILSPELKLNMPEMWSEGSPYTKHSIYDIQSGKMPPVNYDSHTIKSHSVTHAESELHVKADGKSLDKYFADPKYFYGPCLVVRLQGNNYSSSGNGIFQWEVTEKELRDGIERVQGLDKKDFEKILLTTDFYPVNNEGFHDPKYVLTLSQGAANYLIKQPNFNLYGTSWKSSDYAPGSLDRPIHKTLFSKAIIFELLDLKCVPEGEYFFVGMPVRIFGASESPVCPVLFEKNEISI